MSIDKASREPWNERERFWTSAPSRESQELNTLRPEIEASWRRCEVIGVSSGDGDLPYTPDVDRDSRLRRAADPVIDNLVLHLQDAPATILLADSAAQIVDRRAGDAGLRARLDRAYVAPGFRYAEEDTGTNGIGTALEERRPFQVSGGEHFREALQSLACVGVPIIHPITRTVEGILDITSNLSDSNALMGALAQSAVREIQSRLYAESSDREQLLLQSFLQASRRGSSAVVSLNQDVIMTTPMAAQIIDTSDQALLWDWACRMLAGRDEYIGEVRLADNVTVSAAARRVGDSRTPAGIIIEMRQHPRDTKKSSARQLASASPVARRTETVKIPGRSLSTKRLQTELERLASIDAPVLVTGEPGAGKFFAASALHRMRDADGHFTVFDAGTASVDPTAWIAGLVNWNKVDGALIIRHLDLLPEQLVSNVCAVLSEAVDHRAHIIATAGEGVRRGPAGRLCDHFMRRIEIDPLRLRSEDVADISVALLRKHAPDRNGLRLQPTALQLLVARDWPGNVRELESVLASSLLRSMGSDIGVQHLPDGYRDGDLRRRNASTSLELAERDALLRALVETDGNKLLAAQRLGVARSTLYRKMRALGIDGSRFLPQ
ncbi:sigma-54-dependent Fis family transcriptional regulator [Rhodococcus jostii]|uniref:Transcriptional regulator of acetoin/glycerol metabolism n=1 Tax=Rhodococcus jostii TaxID=132919 RepID=A0A1H4R8D6_RHOJO|nr:helix-turn-helix domain-containing protein [Rhodococcus jostii]SEC28180.1 Transcriptional regulator of acetoin/glycerol metabolism [Rhodococcus jostii]